MKVSLISVRELDVDLKTRWDTLRSSNATLGSPFFTWQYLEALALSGRPVRIAVLEQEQQVVAFFAFEAAGRGRITRPGGGLSDYEGLICAPGLAVSPSALLKACGARVYHFDHLPTHNTLPKPRVLAPHISPVMDLQGGWNECVLRLARLQKTTTPGVVQSVKRRKKAAGKQFRELQLTYRSHDHAQLEWLMNSKSRQYQETQAAGNPFAEPDIRRLMHHILDRQEEAFRGVLTLLHGDDTLLAAHFGIQSGPHLHYWFPTYAPEHIQLSPGLIMVHDMGVHAESHGVETLDFGRGDQDYKLRFLTHSTSLSEGVLASPQWLGDGLMASRQLYLRARKGLKSNSTIHRVYHQARSLMHRR